MHTIGIQRESQSADLSARQHGCAVAGVWPDRIPKSCVQANPAGTAIVKSACELRGSSIKRIADLSQSRGPVREVKKVEGVVGNFLNGDARESRFGEHLSRAPLAPDRA